MSRCSSWSFAESNAGSTDRSAVRSTNTITDTSDLAQPGKGSQDPARTQHRLILHHAGRGESARWPVASTSFVAEGSVADRPLQPRWQSIAETVALTVVACAVAWMAISRTSTDAVSIRGGAPTRRPEPPRPLPTEAISLAGAQLLGKSTAQVGIVVYSDFQCPYCGRFAKETLPSLEAQYVRTGKILVAFRQFPLPNHPFAQKAAEAANCAGRQGKFWEFHDRLFANPRALDSPNLLEHARQVKLEPARFAACLDGQETAAVRADHASGGAVGVSGTPTFLVGRLLADGRLKVSQRLSGALPLEHFQTVLDGLFGTPAGAVTDRESPNPRTLRVP